MRRFSGFSAYGTAKSENLDDPRSQQTDRGRPRSASLPGLAALLQPLAEAVHPQLPRLRSRTLPVRRSVRRPLHAGVAQRRDVLEREQLLAAVDERFAKRG